MHRRSVIAGLSGVCAAAISLKMRSAAGWTLITQDQFDEINEPQAAARTGPQSIQPIRVPIIEVLEPDLTKQPITAPVRLRIRFQAPPGASIDVASFRATYGWFDITSQLIGHAKIDASGISADEAEIPSGKYRITLQVSDNKGRVGTQAFNFQIA